MIAVDNTHPDEELTITPSSTDRSKRSDALEGEARRGRGRLEAQAVAGSEREPRTDGGEDRDDDPEEPEITADDLPDLHIGDHVQDRDDEDDTTMLVVGLDTRRADAYELEKGVTIADVNPEHPTEDDVVEVVFAGRVDMEVSSMRRYAYPRARLVLETPIHDRDAEDGGEKR